MEKSLEFLQDMFPLGREIIFNSYEANNQDLDKTISVLISMCDNGKAYPPSYEEATSQEKNTIEIKETENKKRRDSRRNLGKKEWKPPLLGTLPDDFLKVPNEISNYAAATGFLCKGCATMSQLSSLNEDYSLPTTSNSIYSSQIKQSELENIVRRRMEDNVSQTRNLTLKDPSFQSLYQSEDLQYLDDERLALMLQNQEFMRIVKSDPEFQQALKEDQEETCSDSISDQWDDKESTARFSSHEFGDDYGYARSDIVDPDHLWPDHLPSSGNDQNDVSKLCKAMGKASRKRINSLAKRFSSIRLRKSSRNYNSFDFNANGNSRLQIPQISTSIGNRDNQWETESTRQLIEPDLISLASYNYHHSDNDDQSILGDLTSDYQTPLPSSNSNNIPFTSYTLPFNTINNNNNNNTNNNTNNSQSNKSNLTFIEHTTPQIL